MIAELKENAPVHSILSQIEKSQISRGCAIVYISMIGKTVNSVGPTLEVYLVFGCIYSRLWTEKAFFLYCEPRLALHGWGGGGGGGGDHQP